MCAAVIQYQQHFSIDPAIEPLQPFVEYFESHPRFRVPTVGHSNVAKLNVLETTRLLILADNPKGHLVGSITVRAVGNRYTLLVLFSPFQLLCSQSSVKLMQ